MGVTTDLYSNVIKMSNSGDAITGDQAINFLYWCGTAIAAGSDLLVSDSSDNPIWQATGTQADDNQIFPLKNVVNGLKITTLDAGVVYAVRPPHGRRDWDW